MSWTKQFVEMIFPLNREHLDIERAFILKNQHLPSSVFKYREVNEHSIKNLEEDTIWLADPNNFNDPYDCAHTVDYSVIETGLDPIHFKKFMQDKGKDIELSDEQKKLLYASEDPFDKLMDILLTQRFPDKKEEIKSVFLTAKKKMDEDLLRTSSKSIASSFKLCSFSERNDSMLMWAHYASYHQGFCIEYDLEQFSSSDYRRRFLYPVIYSDEMFDATEYFKNSANESFNNLHLSLAALIKAKDWEYESEWRLVFAHGIFDAERAYQIGKPKMVYLGTRISEQNQKRLVDICSRRKISIKKMSTNTSKFNLKPVSLKDAERQLFKG